MVRWRLRGLWTTAVADSSPLGRQSAMVARGRRASGRVNLHRAHGFARLREAHREEIRTSSPYQEAQKVRLGGLDHIRSSRLSRTCKGVPRIPRSR